MRSVLVIVRKASVSHGMSASSNSATSRLSGPGPKSTSVSCARNIMYTWLICGRLMSVYRSPMATRALASSSVSRTAPAGTDSPFSRKPAGSVHRPYRGSIARRHSSTRSCHSGRQPTTTFGFW